MAEKIITLRPVREDDCEMLWHWVNQPEVRKSAFCPDLIPWEEHQAWFRQKIADPNCYIFIALNEKEKPVGQVRFDMIDKDNIQIDISIEKSYRGLGYGKILILLGIEEMLNIASFKTVNSFIKKDNKASIRAFEKAGFTYFQSKIFYGIEAKHYKKGIK